MKYYVIHLYNGNGCKVPHAYTTDKDKALYYRDVADIVILPYTALNRLKSAYFMIDFDK